MPTLHMVVKKQSTTLTSTFFWMPIGEIILIENWLAGMLLLSQEELWPGVPRNNKPSPYPLLKPNTLLPHMQPSKSYGTDHSIWNLISNYLWPQLFLQTIKWQSLYLITPNFTCTWNTSTSIIISYAISFQLKPSTWSMSTPRTI